MLATWHFHIEISSKCTLHCPRCDRQEVPDTLINTELDLEFFKRNFTPEFIRSNVEKITFCGDDGDPIYAHDLIPVVQYIKSVRPVEIVIITNGSHKKPSWWEELGKSLTEIDSVHFSIDGFDNYSNNIYRVNSDYDSIISGIKALRSSKCQIVWAAIAFKFNQDQLDYMQSYADSLGVDRFQLTRSTKFGSIYSSYGSDDSLEPRKELVSSSHRFERDIFDLSKNTSWQPINFTNLRLYQYNKSTINPITPLCAIGNKGLYIDAKGRLFPCCWVANRYSHNNEWQEIAEKFNLNNRTLEDALTDTFWDGDFKSFRWQECQTKCRSDLVTENYAVNW